MDMSTIYHLLSLINLAAVTLSVLYAKKLYDSTRGAADFWLFLSAFIFSLGAYILFDFIEKLFSVTFESPIHAAQDMSISFARKCSMK